MSKPTPNNPQTRMRLIVVGENPRYGSTNGAATSATAVSATMLEKRCLNMRRLCSFAGRGAEQTVRPQHQYQRHGHEQHDVGIARVEHRCDADDLASDQATENGTGKGADPADHDDDECLHQDRLADIGRDRDNRSVDDASKASRHGANTEHQHEDLVDIDAKRIDHGGILNASAHDHADTGTVKH